MRLWMKTLLLQVDGHLSFFFLLNAGRFRRGVPDDRKIWSATALVHERYQSVLADVHRSFLDAGADAITTNSYGVVPGVGFTSEEISKHVATSGRIARQVADSFQNDSKPAKKLVLGSLGPLLESYRPDKLMEVQEGIRMYGIIARALLPYVDVFLAETMSCVEEASQAIQAVGQLIAEQNTESGCRTMIVSYTLDSHGKLRNGESATSAVIRTLDLCKAHQMERK
jgi:methionine synthase I (cobalamin-dependent)